MSNRNTVSNRGQNAIYDFVVVSRDYAGMETAFESLPHSYRRSQIGSGYSFFDGSRDHHFVVRGIDRARHILNHYRRLLRKRKRGGFKVFDNLEDYADHAS
jgi:hypothetical protein